VSLVTIFEFEKERHRNFRRCQTTRPRPGNRHYSTFPCIRFIQSESGEIDGQVIYTEDDPLPPGMVELKPEVEDPSWEFESPSWTPSFFVNGQPVIK
jgi:hypothetical protein